jgi:hypothetical protein
MHTRTTIPRLTPDELRRLSGGRLVVRYIECVGRLERLPDAGWLRQRLDDTGQELSARMATGTLSEALCGLVSHHRGPLRLSTECGCETPSVEEGGWGQPG